jgi:hypothetical protein
MEREMVVVRNNPRGDDESRASSSLLRLGVAMLGITVVCVAAMLWLMHEKEAAGVRVAVSEPETASKIVPEAASKVMEPPAQIAPIEYTPSPEAMTAMVARAQAETFRKRREQEDMKPPEERSPRIPSEELIRAMEEGKAVLQ